MDSSLIAACVSATVTAVGLFLGYIQWRRDVRVKVDEIRKEVSLKLVTERIEPYTELMQGLEIASTFHREGLQPELGELLDALQKAIYGRVGLLASHTTRQILLYCRDGAQKLAGGRIDHGDLVIRLWALHFSLRADLGITQPEWPNEVDAVQKAASKQHISAYERLRLYPWESVDLARRNPLHLPGDEKN